MNYVEVPAVLWEAMEPSNLADVINSAVDDLTEFELPDQFRAYVEGEPNELRDMVDMLLKWRPHHGELRRSHQFFHPLERLNGCIESALEHGLDGETPLTDEERQRVDELVKAYANK